MRGALAEEEEAMRMDDSGWRAARSLVLIAAVVAAASRAGGGTIRSLVEDVEIDGRVIGQVRMHVGTHNYRLDGNAGLGRAAPHAEKSGFHVADGESLAAGAAAAGWHHFNWLQIVTEQPRRHAAAFGAVPHADPSDHARNPWPRDDAPWYLNEGSGGAAPAAAINRAFDLPPATSTLLPFQDFPWGFSILGESIAFDTYLVGIGDATQRTFEVLHGFRWRVTLQPADGETGRRTEVTLLESLETDLPLAYQRLAATYGDSGWRVVPEPAATALVFGGWLVLRIRRRG